MLGDTWVGAAWHDQGLPHVTMGEGHVALEPYGVEGAT